MKTKSILLELVSLLPIPIYIFILWEDKLVLFGKNIQVFDCDEFINYIKLIRSNKIKVC